VTGILKLILIKYSGKMKKFGLIGGVGPESTIEYYRLIIKRYKEILETEDYPEMLINIINVKDIIYCVKNRKLDNLVDILADKVFTLEASGVDFGAIAANTPHIVFDRLVERVKLPLISIVEETCRELKHKDLKRTLLMGTRFTMTAGFYQNVAGKYGIDLLIPEPENREYVHNKYMDELIYNRIFPETKQRLIDIVNEIKESDSIDSVILGGTELPLILNQPDFEDIVVLDTAKIHVESIVRRMIEN
jgi:aspartate racemase